MRLELRKKIVAYNRKLAEQKEKASDLDILIGELLKLPPGQLKKALSSDVIAILKKHGYTI